MIVGSQLKAINTQDIIVDHVGNVKRQRKPNLDYYRAIIKRNIFGPKKNPSKEI